MNHIRLGLIYKNIMSSDLIGYISVNIWDHILFEFDFSPE